MRGAFLAGRPATDYDQIELVRHSRPHYQV
jgi:hypothetical protein